MAAPKVAALLVLVVCGSVCGSRFESPGGRAGLGGYDGGPVAYQPSQSLDQDYQEYANTEEEEDGQYREELYSNANTIPGLPGSDYPILASIPNTGFTCADKLPGFYADEAAFCQVWHYCKIDGIKESFLCPNGTIYNQANRVCEWWFNVHCEDTVAAYRVNEDLYIIPSSTPGPDDYPLPDEDELPYYSY